MTELIMMEDDIGYVKYDEHMGSDKKIAEIAGISRDVVPDAELCKKLLSWNPKHESPFEQAVIRFKIKMPIFVLRQMVRHRTHSMMEKSLRYCNASDTEVFLPTNFRNEKGELIEDQILADANVLELYDNAIKNYQSLLEIGVCKEQARIILPVGVYTEFYWLQNLRNLFNFLRLRTNKHAQKEIRDYAEAICKIVKEIYPISYQAWEDYIKIK